jgi:hypothetical protein
LIWETRNGHSHPGGTDQRRDKDKQVLGLAGQILADGVSDGDQQNTGYRVADES